jgi:hypothetical protein
MLSISRQQTEPARLCHNTASSWPLLGTLTRFSRPESGPYLCTLYSNASRRRCRRRSTALWAFNRAPLAFLQARSEKRATPYLSTRWSWTHPATGPRSLCTHRPHGARRPAPDPWLLARRSLRWPVAPSPSAPDRSGGLWPWALGPAGILDGG